jgi:hypothetical protein
MENNFNGSFQGIVIQNNDPEKRGRVKVYIPHISPEVYNNWDETKVDRSFVFPDKDTNPDLDAILPYLKEALPWAEICMPIFGGNSSGRYNAYLRKGTTSDANSWQLKDEASLDLNLANEEPTELIEGNRPAHLYTRELRTNDAFNETDKNGNRFVNPYSYNFTPSDYSNLARGSFSIPNVGAHVWVFFNGGDPNFPVVFGAAFGQEDWKRIYSQNKADEDENKFVSEDYPESFENVSKDETLEGSDISNLGGGMNHNHKTFRSKTVFNSNKHVIEMIDTDHKETLKFTHYSGGFKEFNNFTNSEFAPNNNQLLVNKDQFVTIKGNNSTFIGGHKEQIISGDKYETIGMFKKFSIIGNQILTYLKQIHEFKRLFEVSRVNGLGSRHCSKLQTKVGAPNSCPTCQGTGFKLLLPCITCKGTGLSPSTQDGSYIPEMLKWTPSAAEWPWWFNITKSWSMAGYGVVWDPSIMMFRNIASVPIPIDATHPTVDMSMWPRVWPELDKTVEFPITFFARTIHRLIIPLEAQLGNGGDEIKNIAGNTTITCGAVFNDMESYRIDPVGKIRPTRTAIDPMMTYVALKELPLVEYVDVDNVPGGDYTLTCGNKYQLTVGSKGIRIKTTGPLDMYGSIVNFTGESVNISSKNEVLIDGGDYLELRASNITIKPHETIKQEETANSTARTADQYVLLDGNVGIKNNLTVVGGAHIEGEMSFIHAQAPDFRYMTEVAYGPLPHVHVFHAPPWTLHSPYVSLAMAVRSAQLDLNVPIPKPNIYTPGRWVPI